MSFFEELRRRSVFKAAILYVVSAWVVLQLTDVMSSLLSLPEWTGPIVVTLLVLGIFPVLVFAWAFEITPEGIKRDEDVDRSQAARVGAGRKASLLIVVVLVVAIGIWISNRLILESSPEPDVAAEAPTGTPPTPGDSIPVEKPSIAVLPFVNMSGDAEQDYFADGMSEDIITKLTHVRGMRVISRNSTLRYKDTVADARQIGEELGVRHILEGSVRRSGDQLRITVALIDSTTSEPVWTEQWDRTLTDIFKLQDEITANIINELEIELVEGEQRRVVQQSTDNPDAYGALRRGIAAFEKLPKTLESISGARRWFRTATELDPEYASAYAWMALGHAEEAIHPFGTDPDASLGEAETWVQRALELDDSLSINYDTLGWIRFLRGDFEKAYENQRKALELAPGNADALVLIAETMCILGMPEDALRSVMKGMERNPYPPWWYWWGLGQTHMYLGNYQEALDATEKSFAMYSDYEPTRLNLVIQLMGLDRKAEARAQAEELLRINPDFKAESLAYLNSMQDQERKAQFFSLLEEAGLR